MSCLDAASCQAHAFLRDMGNRPGMIACDIFIPAHEQSIVTAHQHTASSNGSSITTSNGDDTSMHVTSDPPPFTRWHIVNVHLVPSLPSHASLTYRIVNMLNMLVGRDVRVLRAQQATWLQTHVTQFTHMPCVVAGDFNIRYEDAEFTRLCQHVSSAQIEHIPLLPPHTPTAITHQSPHTQIDHVLGNIRAAQTWAKSVHQHDMPVEPLHCWRVPHLFGSDHWPVCVS